MSDIDDDLLALAGGEEDDLSDEQPDILKKRSKTKKVTGSDDEGEDQGGIDDAADHGIPHGGSSKGDDMSGDEDLEELALGNTRNRRDSDTRKRKSRDDDEINQDVEMDDNEIEDDVQVGDVIDVDDDDDDFEARFANPYPLEGKYKDSADRDRLESLPEIERESILFDRSQEIERYNQKLYLAQHARQRRLAEKKLQKEAEQTTRGKREKSSAASTKANKLSELKKKREEKQSREKTGKTQLYRDRKRGSDDEYQDDDDSDYNNRGRGSLKKKRGSYDDDDDFIEHDEEEAVEWAETKKSRELTVHDINKIRFGRTLFAKFCHNPNFESVVIGTFVRVNIGNDRQNHRSIYRICEVKGLTKSKPYTFQGRTVDEVLVVASSKQERTFEMGICSDSPFTDEEFDWWKNRLKTDRISSPSSKYVDRKLAELKEFKNHTLTDSEVRDMVERRQKLSANMGVGVSRVLQKSSLQEQRAIALENGDMRAVEDIDRKINGIEQAKVVAENASMGKLAAVNARNRRANVSGVRQAELKNVESRRKQGKVGSTGDPFSRLRTNAKIFHDDSPIVKANGNGVKEDEKKTKEQEEADARKRKVAAKLAYSAVDDKIASIPFQLDIVI